MIFTLGCVQEEKSTVTTITSKSTSTITTTTLISPKSDCGEVNENALLLLGTQEETERLECMNQKIIKCEKGGLKITSEVGDMFLKINEKIGNNCVISLETDKEIRTCKVPLKVTSQIQEELKQTDREGELVFGVMLAMRLRGYTSVRGEITNIECTRNPPMTIEKCELERFPSHCLSSLAVDTKNSSICDRITDRVSRSRCYKDVAIAKGDQTLCDSSNSFKLECYNAVARVKKDVDVCDEYPNAICYRDMAILLNDTRICDKIQDSRSKEECIESILTWDQRGKGKNSGKN